MPKISVIIPANNEEEYLGKTLHGLRQQNFLDYETIVVCNGCTDNTQKVAQNFLNQNTNIISLPEANVSLAKNKGAEKAIGSILLFLDADTLLEQDSLNKILKGFTKEYSVATTKTKPDRNRFKYKLALAFKNFYNQLKIYQGCSGALICNKNDFEEVRGYDSSIIVKEHRKLIIKLKKLGKYKVINTTAITSMRRFEQWGLGKATFFWIKEWIKNYLSDLKKSEYERVR